MLRRRTLLLATGAAAAAAGVAAYLWRRPGGAEPPPPRLWELRLPRPGGGFVEFAQLRGRPLLVNFWATWCVPCIREMPEIDRFAAEFAANGWQVVGVAVDQKNPVLEYLARRPVSYPIALAGFEGLELGRTLGNDAGALPFTVAFAADGRVVKRKLGETRFEELRAWAQTAAQPAAKTGRS
jgi:thiol-disulfide isomerase/thioredoxin